MCIAFILWQCHPCYRLYLASNRDELLSRPTLPAHWWTEHGILGGKDLCLGGTWLGCTKNGRLALLTNVREPATDSSTLSRGELTTLFLQSSKSPAEYAEEVFVTGNKYNGFNLLLADLCTGNMAYVSNRPEKKPVLMQEVLPGFHVLSNESLDSPWPKALRGQMKLEELIAKAGKSEISTEHVINEILKDVTKAEDSALPRTGYPLDWEHKLSSIFVDCETEKGHYGTRSMAIVSVLHDGGVVLHERFLEDGVWKEHDFCFHIPNEGWKAIETSTNCST